MKKMFSKKLELENIKTPSDKIFGLFFSALFFFLFIYFYTKNQGFIAILFLLTSIILCIFSIFNSKKLHPLNKCWMQFGQLLGKISSPIILGFIFFGIFTPMGILMRILGRDELRLKMKPQKSFWKMRQPSLISSNTFKNQF
jgi:hypothetical protein